MLTLSAPLKFTNEHYIMLSKLTLKIPFDRIAMLQQDGHTPQNVEISQFMCFIQHLCRNCNQMKLFKILKWDRIFSLLFFIDKITKEHLSHNFHNEITTALALPLLYTACVADSFYMLLLIKVLSDLFLSSGFEWCIASS